MTARTRFEPAPTGSLHVGHGLAAAFNWLYARKHGGAFALRFADTDRERNVEGGAEAAMEDLRWLGLDWDEGPFKQSERIPLYREAAAKLLAAVAAYRCYCTPAELDARRKQALAEKRPPGYDGRCRRLTEAETAAFEAEGRASAIRFKMPEGRTEITDLVRGDAVFEHVPANDVVIVRADGWPLYNLAATYDDMSMGITHVLRGEDIFANTAIQVQLIRALGGEPPRYGHFPLLIGPGGRKLSKRAGDPPVSGYRDMGILPEVLINYLVILDWSVGDGVTERFTIPELIEAFDPSGITRNPSAFDQAKLEAFNGERIRELSADEFIERCMPFLRGAGIDVGAEDEDASLRAIAPLVQERCKRLDEVPGQVRFLYERVEPDERAAAMLTGEHAPALEAALGIVGSAEPWEAGALQEALNAWAEGAGMKKKVAFQPVRAAITGSLVSPPLFESIEILGREEAGARLRKALDRARA